MGIGTGNSKFLACKYTSCCSINSYDIVFHEVPILEHSFGYPAFQIVGPTRMSFYSNHRVGVRKISEICLTCKLREPLGDFGSPLSRLFPLEVGLRLHVILHVIEGAAQWTIRMESKIGDSWALPVGSPSDGDQRTCLRGGSGPTWRPRVSQSGSRTSPRHVTVTWRSASGRCTVTNGRVICIGRGGFLPSGRVSRR